MDNIYNALVLEKQYSDNSEMFIVTKNIIEQFYREVILNNSIPLIVVFPNKWDVLELMRGNKLRYLGLLNFFEENNLQYIDLISIFNSVELTREIIYNDLFIPHYSPFVNNLVADEIINKIDETYSINKNISNN